ncbi:MAG TPA: hypothetical protein VGU63_03045 [Candidatus Acidoferrales bacterium]|nr:hypothetical protein [Candidatus Acidoferrales bacterium]
MRTKLLVVLVAASLVILPPARAMSVSTELRPETVRAFENYIQNAEVGVQAHCQPRGPFLWIDGTAHNSGRFGANPPLKIALVQCLEGCKSSGVHVPGGLIHDWLGVIFVPGVSLSQTLSVVQDYDHARNYYCPDVLKSKLLSRSGNLFRVFLQLKQTDVLTVVFNTEYEIRYEQVSASRACSLSHSTRIAEVENAGEAAEREKSPAQDSGFLWRLDSYWSFEQADGGVYIQCRAISLTRDIPTGLNWIVAPFIKDVPAKSLRFTLSATRDALLRKFPHSTDHK